MKKCLIIGGGLAGLSAAVNLSKNSFHVTLLEASPKLGGRAYSFPDEKHGHYIDNGQHIMMGCYKHSFEMLNIIDAMDEVEIQDKLTVPFVDNCGRELFLNSGSNFYPFNLALSILNYKALTVEERLSVLKFFINNILYGAGLEADKSVDAWLKGGGQNGNAINSFWNILAIGTLNAPIEVASAVLFRSVLKEIFLTGNKSAKIVFPKTSLSETFALKAKTYLEKQGAEILLSHRVSSIGLSNMEVTTINTGKKDFNSFDYVISAIPVNAFTKIQFNPVIPKFKLPSLESSPIVSVHLWLKENPFKLKFYGLIDSPVHWLFNRGTYITLVTSAAGELVNKKNNEIIFQLIFEIQKFFPYFNADGILDSLVVKEKHATFLPAMASNPERKNFYSPLTNLVFAGDWTDTKLPATIEGAIKSGRSAAELVMKMC